MLGAFESPEGMIHCSYSPSWVKGGLSHIPYPN